MSPTSCNPPPASRRVQITGGAAGIGKAAPTRCRADGYEVIVFDRDSDGIRADLSNPGATASALEEELSGGPFTRLVNNVGIVRPGSVDEQTLADLDIAASLNMRCSLQSLQALLPGMKAARFVFHLARRSARNCAPFTRRRQRV
jgi:3-oxoacyl-[acyl-carrier protein] reductase